MINDVEPLTSSDTEPQEQNWHRHIQPSLVVSARSHQVGFRYRKSNHQSSFPVDAVESAVTTKDLRPLKGVGLAAASGSCLCADRPRGAELLEEEADRTIRTRDGHKHSLQTNQT